MIVIPNYSYGDIVNVTLEDHIEPVKIIETSVVIESQEVFYKVVLFGQNDSTEFVINECDILTGYARVPSPSFAVGDLIEFNHAIITEGSDNVDWDVRSGVIEKVFICWDEMGYTIYYKTDEHTDNDYVLEDNIISSNLDEEISDVG